VRLQCFTAITFNLNADVKNVRKVEVMWKEKEICTLKGKKGQMKNVKGLDHMSDSLSLPVSLLGSLIVSLSSEIVEDSYLKLRLLPKSQFYREAPNAEDLRISSTDIKEALKATGTVRYRREPSELADALERLETGLNQNVHIASGDAVTSLHYVSGACYTILLTPRK